MFLNCKIFVNIVFYFFSELFGKYILHTEVYSSKTFNYYRLVYGGILLSISVYLMDQITKEKFLYIFLLFILTISRIVVSSEYTDESADVSWFSSQSVLHLPISINFSFIITLLLFYNQFSNGLIALVIILITLNFIFGVPLLHGKTNSTISPALLVMTGLDLTLELLPLIGSENLIPSAVIEEIIEIVFYVFASSYMTNNFSRDSFTSEQSQSNSLKYLLYFFLCSLDLAIESFRSSSCVMLICSYISESLVFWTCYIVDLSRTRKQINRLVK